MEHSRHKCPSIVHQWFSARSSSLHPRGHLESWRGIFRCPNGWLLACGEEEPGMTNLLRSTRKMHQASVSIVSAKMHYTSPGCWDIWIISNLAAILSNSGESPYTKMLVFNSFLKTLSQKGHYMPPKSYTKDFWYISPKVPPGKLNLPSASGDKH